MLFRQLWDNESSTFTYLLGDEQTGDAVLIDAVKQSMERDLQLVSELGLTLRYVLDTHVHADHVTAAGGIAEKTGAQSVAGRLGAGCAQLHVTGGDRLAFGGYQIEVIDTPGHTDDSVSYKVEDRVFTGDALLIRGCGRTDFQNGDAGQLYHSVTAKLFTLPDATFVHPAHDYHGRTVTTVLEEKRFNPRLAGKSLQQFVEIMHNLKLDLPAKIMEAVPANRACGLSGAVNA